MNRKGEWYARDWIVAMILFSSVIVLLFISATDAFNTYGRGDLVDPDFNAKYDRFSNNTQAVADMFNATSGTGGLNPIGQVEVFFQSTFTVIQLIFSSIGIFNSQIANMASDFGVPSVIANIIFPAIIGVITVMIIFIVISSVNRNKI